MGKVFPADKNNVRFFRFACLETIIIIEESLTYRHAGLEAQQDLKMVKVGSGAVIFIKTSRKQVSMASTY
jgi:hypothetical protein